jgi:hypothetical protein
MIGLFLSCSGSETVAQMRGPLDVQNIGVALGLTHVEVNCICCSNY